MSSRTFGRVAGLACLGVLMIGGTCGLVLTEPDPGVEWTPPPAYREIWKSAEACTGKTGDYDRVSWRMVPGHDWKCEAGQACIGQWRRPHTILMAEGWIGTAWVAKHEMVHELLQMPHPDDRETNDSIWGRSCHAEWGYLVSEDSTYKP